MDTADYMAIRAAVAMDYAGDIEWSEGVKPPVNATDFAEEAIYVILNSGMKWTVARRIWDERVQPALHAKGKIDDEFKHPGKREAINRIWRDRGALFAKFLLCQSDTVRLNFCGDLPWIGGITKYHLAKNLGVDCAKPDRHLDRISRMYGTDTHSLCAALSKQTGDRIATVDYVIWRACEMGVLDSRRAAKE